MIEEIEIDINHQQALENQQEKVKKDQQQTEVRCLNHLSLYYSFIQRYFTTYQSKNQYVHLHSNGLAIIRPKITSLPAKPIKIQFLLQLVEVKGKKKKGGVRVKSNTNIAKIHCEGELFMKVAACVQGTIIQTNTNVKIQNIQHDESFLVIILPVKRFVPQQVGMRKVTYLNNLSQQAS